MKKSLTLAFILLVFFGCAKNDTPERDYTEQLDSAKEVVVLSDEEVQLRYSTYIVIKERLFEDRYDGRYVKMKTDIVNKTDKDILCIKGEIVIRDDYTGEEYCTFLVDCPKDIAANSRIEHITGEYRCDTTVYMHRKLMTMDQCEFNSWVSWDVHQIKFGDGTKIGSEKPAKQPAENQK